MILYPWMYAVLLAGNLAFMLIASVYHCPICTIIGCFGVLANWWMMRQAQRFFGGRW